MLRAGYGIFFSRVQTGLISTLFLTNGVYQQPITYNRATAAQLAAGPVYPNFLPSTSFTPPAGSVDIVFADKNLRNPYTHQANIGIERELTSTMSLSVSYLWSRGVRLYGVRDLNVGPLGAPVTYTILDPSGSVAGTYTTPTYRLPRPDTRYRRRRADRQPGAELLQRPGGSVQPPFRPLVSRPGRHIRGRTRSTSTRAAPTTISFSAPRRRAMRTATLPGRRVPRSTTSAIASWSIRCGRRPSSKVRARSPAT